MRALFLFIYVACGQPWSVVFVSLRCGFLWGRRRRCGYLAAVGLGGAGLIAPVSSAVELVTALRVGGDVGHRTKDTLKCNQKWTPARMCLSTH